MCSLNRTLEVLIHVLAPDSVLCVNPQHIRSRHFLKLSYAHKDISNYFSSNNQDMISSQLLLLLWSKAASSCSISKQSPEPIYLIRLL